MKNSLKSPRLTFAGRVTEVTNLQRIGAAEEPALVVVYGRRRVGKTTLIERVYGNRGLIKLEGVEGGDKATQMGTALIMLAKYAQDPTIAHLKFERWLEFFQFVARFVSKGKKTLYLEELQWLACYDSELISDFKIVWDNELRKNPHLVVVFCGSSPSFMVHKVLKSKALYGRSQHELSIDPLTFHETLEYFGPSFVPEAVLDCYLTVGGIPEYLSYLRRTKSTYLELCHQSFVKDGYFFNECERVFISSLAQNPHYRKIIDLLARERFATRPTIAAKLGLDSGGTFTNLLQDLEASGFINAYVPFQKKDNSKLVRYEIADDYLQFYYRFIFPKQKRIRENMYIEGPSRALNLTDYGQWLGYSFERWCRKNHRVIARILGFSAVNYEVGSYFSKSTPEHFQIDLIFSRADRVLTVCEIKYTKTPVSQSVVREFERKLELLPRPSRYNIEKVLISPSGADSSVLERAYFDHIIDLSRLISQGPIR